ncbi:hypothetical protein [Thioclava sp. GXIMD4216]|uniref:hypothetical protein n=1 Tax=Thioclava sp. GXIMD4216 TaxID=3131929 RepID=UPI0030CE5D1A
MDSQVETSVAIDPSGTGSPNLGGLVGLFQAELGHTGEAQFTMGTYFTVPTAVSIDYPDAIQIEQPIVIDDLAEAPISAAEMMLMMEAGDEFYTADYAALLEDGGDSLVDGHSYAAGAEEALQDADALGFDWAAGAVADDTTAEPSYVDMESAAYTMPDYADAPAHYEEAALDFESMDSFIFFEHEG